MVATKDVLTKTIFKIFTVKLKGLEQAFSNLPLWQNEAGYRALLDFDNKPHVILFFCRLMLVNPEKMADLLKQVEMEDFYEARIHIAEWLDSLSYPDALSIDNANRAKFPESASDLSSILCILRPIDERIIDKFFEFGKLKADIAEKAKAKESEILATKKLRNKVMSRLYREKCMSCRAPLGLDLDESCCKLINADKQRYILINCGHIVCFNCSNHDICGECKLENKAAMAVYLS